MSGFVYAIGDGEGRVKIGWSANPFSRLTKLRADCGGRAHLLGIVPGTKSQEKEIQTLLQAYRAHGDWFWLRGPVLQFVGALSMPRPRAVIVETSSALKHWRLQRGLSLEDVAQMLGVTRVSISRWEREKRHPNIELLKRLSAMTGLSADQLLGVAA